MIEANLVYKNQKNIPVKWMRDVWKEYKQPDSVELEISSSLLGTEQKWLKDVLDWAYKNNDNRDVKINNKFYIVDDFNHA